MRHTTLFLLLLALVICVIICAPTPVHAESGRVTQPIVCTMDNGATPVPPVTLTLSGGSPSPSTITCNGNTVSVVVTNDTTLIATEPAGGAHTRDVFEGGLMTASVITCLTDTGTTCATWPITNYEQLQNTFEVTANAQPNFDTGLTWTLSCTQAGAPGNCQISSSSASTDSSQLWTDYERSVTYPVDPSGAPAYSRWEGTGTLSFAPSSGGTTDNVQYYKQWQNIFTATAMAQTVFDAGLTAAITGQNLGTSVILCTISPVGGEPVGSCPQSIWIDNGASANFAPRMGGSPSTEQWVCGESCSTVAITSGGSTYTTRYFKQVSESFDFSINGGGSGYSPPPLRCSQFGVSATCGTLSTSPSSFWLDYGSRWTAMTPLTGSTGAEGWYSGNATGVSIENAQKTIVYYHQFGVSVKYSLSGGGNIPEAPSISYKAYGETTTSQLTTTATVVWMDIDQSFGLSPILGASGERWASPSSTFSVLSGAAYSITLYHQYEFQLAYSIVGGGTVSSVPDFGFTNFTASASFPLSQTGSTYWVDSGTTWTVTNPLAGSGLTERWQTPQASSGEASSSVIETVKYYHQYMMTFSFSIVGGGTGYAPPSVVFLQFDMVLNSTQGWVDAGTTFAYTNPLVGSSSTGRWSTGTPNGTITSSATITTVYYHQFSFSLSYRVVPPGSEYVPPVMNLTALGVSQSTPIPESPSVLWLDSQSSWSATAMLEGSTATARWATNIPTTGLVYGPEAVTFDYYRQFRVNFSYTVKLGGSPSPPMVLFTSFDNSSQITLSHGNSSAWVDSGTSWSYPNLLPNSTIHERWSASVTTSGTVTSASYFSISYVHQYFLQTTSNSILGGSFANSTGWHDSGSQVIVNATASSGWRFIYWAGVGGGAYNGSFSYHPFPLNGPANETAIFYPGLSITASGGGFVTYQVGSLTGNVTGTQVVYLPLDSNVTLRANPAAFDYVFIGWSEYGSGTNPTTYVLADSPHPITASFSLDYADLTVVGLFVPVVLIMAVYILVVRRVIRKPKT